MGLAYLKYLYLAHFSKPVGDRALYQAIRRLPARRILEIGIGSADRTMRLVKLARRSAGREPVRYVAIDLFEGRGPDLPRGLSLKETHRLLAATDVPTQLIPGEAAQVLARAANSLANMDLVLISAQHDVMSLAGGWFYVPRMLHPGSQVFLETRAAEGGTSLRLMPATEIEVLASSARRRAA
ncbi:MAG: hypothetical protein WD845_18230 [Pirellulales bacterium]